MGLKCFDTSDTCFCLGRGVTSAIFHDIGRQPSRYEVTSILMTGLARMFAFSLKIHPGRESGPGAFEGLRCDKSWNTEYSLVTILSILLELRLGIKGA